MFIMGFHYCWSSTRFDSRTSAFLIYINVLTENLQSNPELFADENSLFTIRNDPNATAKQLCQDLDKITEWAFQWKTSLNPEPPTQMQEFIFTRKDKKLVHPPIFFNNKPVQHILPQKHLGLTLDISLTFTEHTKAIKSKVSKIAGLLGKSNNRLPRSSLTTIYKSLVRAHLDYGDVIFGKASNNFFQQGGFPLNKRLEYLQYKTSHSNMGY